MNSAQRRHAKRVFQHVVILGPVAGDRWFEHDDRIDKSRAWCRKNLKKGSWLFADEWDKAEFKFTNEKDATYFALKWS